MIIWMWQALPRKQKLGIALGIAANLIYNMYRVATKSSSDTAGSGGGSPATTPSPHIIYS
jgi:hypothetical protein